MSKVKFTPGKWKAHTTMNADWVMTDWSDCEEQETICDCSHYNGGNDVYLIAAAPEMHQFGTEAVEIMRRIAGMFGVPYSLRDELEEQIEKWEKIERKVEGLE